MTPNQTNSQDVLRQEILADARRNAERITRHAERDAQRLFQETQAEADRNRRQRLDDAHREAQRRRELLLATIPVEEARMRAERTEAVLDAIREEAEKRIQAREGFDPRETLVRLAAEAVPQMQGERFILELGPEDLRAGGKDLADQVRRRLSPKKPEVTVAPEAAKIEAGVIIRDDEGRQVWDNSLGARLARLWPAIRQRIGARLIREDANRSDKEA